MENLNGFISKNNLVLDIKDKYKCKICNGVLVEAVTSRCLCSFCKKCVVEYLNEEEKPCPGCEMNNRETILNYSSDIKENFLFDAKIQKCKSKCVFSNCDEEIELQNMLEHIQLCVHGDNLCSGEISTLKEVSILRNVINEINEQNIKLSLEMKERVNKLEKDKNDMKKENEELRKENVEIRKENEELKNNYIEINNKLDNFVKNNKEETEKLKKENVELRIKYENNTRDNNEMKKKVEENEERMKRVVESLNEDMKLLKEKNELRNNEKKESIEKRINQHNYTFTNMSQVRRDGWHDSPPFQLSNYEFRFRINYRNDGEIVIRIELLASSNDSSNEWPIKKKFILEVIKNDIPVLRREFDHNSSQFKYHYEKVIWCGTVMRDSEIRTYDTKSIFENDNLNLKLSLN